MGRAWWALVFVACTTRPAPPAPSERSPPTTVTTHRDASAPATPSADGVYRLVGEDYRPIQPSRVLLFADQNDNTRYQLMVAYRDDAEPPSGSGALVMGNTVVRATGTTLFFQLTADEATRAATLLHVRRQDRHPVGDLVVGHFTTTRQTYAAGESIEIVFELANPAAAPAVHYTAGGRQRGARDNQFSFTITRNGMPVPPITADDTGGLAAMPVLQPGERGEVRRPLAGWGDVGAPGHYVVECRWESEFSPGDVNRFDDDHRGDIWDKAFVGTVSFDVR